ncbi:MAG: NUDIX domain-containing protein, partial [Bacteroidales bacterium]|nr:NUDIX domain-containing protein [Bacteroidales bacterium]
MLFNESRSPLLQKAKVIFSDDIVADYIKLFLTDGNDQNLEVCGVSDAEAMEFLASCVKIVNAGGGLVKDSDGRFLFIRRLGCWDLPKGWLEAGETIGECAVREVCEECGIAKNELVLGEKLTKTYHIYPYNGI